jgi:hypothetical protein
MDQTRRHFRTAANPGAALLCLIALNGAATTAHAVEPRLANEPYLLSEPTELTQVVDAFDDGDPFDLNLSVGYQYTNHAASVLRENGGTGTIEVARYKESTHRLNTRADIGLYHDIAFYLRMPIILANDRSLEAAGATGSAAGTAAMPYDSAPLFGLPFNAPTRSGIEYLAAGLDFGITNQYRDASKPTWVLGFEGRFDVSAPMHACNANPAAGQERCADPGDVNRNGIYDADLTDSVAPPEERTRLENSTLSSRKPGVGRGVTGLEIHTYVSKRIKYVEPYGGLRFLAEFPKANSDYKALDFEASLVNRPPLEGSFIVGLAIIPWEVRSAYQRTTIDLRFTSTYRSEGRDYSELYDALGSSESRSLRTPAWTGYRKSATDDSSVVDTSSQRVYFNGLTDVQHHVKNRFHAEFTWQAARFVKFGVGLGYTLIQSHYITNDQACNADITDRPDESGPCRKDGTATTGATPFNVTGVPNPNYRQPINVVGRRYLVSDSNMLDGWIHATVMF